MLAHVLAKTLALWVSVVFLAGLAYARATYTQALDARITWAVMPVAAAWVGGLLVCSLGRRRWRWPALDADRLGLSLLMAMLCIVALSEVDPQTSVHVIREAVPPLFAWIYPTLAFAATVLLGATARRMRPSHQALLGALALTGLSGALLLMDGPVALVVAAVVLLMCLRDGDGAAIRGRLASSAALVVTLLLVSTWVAPNPFTATPSAMWVVAASFLGLALASRTQDARDWVSVTGALVFGGVLIALCGALLTADLARRVDLVPALDTRLTLFRQHPNFLAPYFALTATLATGLALGAPRRRWPWAGAALLLAASTVLTDSKAGIVSLVLGLAGLGILPALGALARRHGARPVAALGLAAILAAAAATWAVSENPGIVSRLERVQKSFDYRSDAWRNSLAIVENSPWIGIGPATFISQERFAPGSRFFNEATSPHPHNTFLYVAQAAGVPTLLAFLAWLVFLFVRLWRLQQRGQAPPLLPAALMSGLGALLAANMLDVGLSLDTVVPMPVFLITGLVLARPTPKDTRAPIRGILSSLVILTFLVPWGWGAVHARTHLDLGRLTSYSAARRHADPQLMASAREHMRAAIDLDPNLTPAYELLARWIESTEDGFMRAREVLEELVARAPHYGPNLSLLGELFVRYHLFEPAAETLLAALEDSHGSVFLSRDRANAIWSLAQVGRRDEARQLLVDALRLDVGVIARVPWKKDPESGERLLPVPDGEALPLVEAIEILFQRHVVEQEAGIEVGRRFWLDTYNAFRLAERNDRAAAVLDYLEEHVPSIDRDTLLSERGNMAMEEGAFEDALHYYEGAFEVAPPNSQAFFQQRITSARHALGLETDTRASAAAFAATGEILDQPTAFRDNLNARAEALQAGDPAQAGALLVRSLLFEDDTLRRAEILTRAARLLLDGGETEAALDAVVQAHAHLGSRPYPLSSFQTGFVEGTPLTLARLAHEAWCAQGLDHAGRLQAAWSVPDFFDSRLGPSLFRLGFYSANGQPDILLREARLQILEDPHNLLAMWAQLEAHEGLGHFRDASETMRDIAVSFGAARDLDALQERLVARYAATLESDPEAWRQVALFTLLRGRYREAIGMFATASRMVTPQDPEAGARMLGWQARSELLAGQDGATERARAALAAAVAQAPGELMLKVRLEVFP